ncbi:helix-turn-helix transcriptional regulator [Mycoplasmatota bacterium]|nr:helix-turn-helix transcriptional regulator [Mycoplasmatota bacterium]
MNTINENIRRLRDIKGMTQQEIADGLYVTRQCVSRWEQGKTIPDIKSIERLATLLDCSINDLIDNDSVKSIAIEQAISNKKKARYRWVSIVISILAISIPIVGYINSKRNEEYVPAIQTEYAYIKEVDNENGKVYFSTTLTDLELPVFSVHTSDVEILDNRDNIINYVDLKVDDKVRIRYDPNTNEFYKIKVIDSKVHSSLLGIFVSYTGEDYNNINDLYEKWGVKLFIADDVANRTNLEYDVEFILEDIYRAEVYDIYVYINELKIINDLEIGLITSEGIEMVDIVDLKNPPIYTYSGEYEDDYNNFFTVNSVDVTYKVHINYKFSYSSIEVYEYDKNNQLIKESTLYTYDDVLFFSAHEDGLYCKVKINSTYSNGNKSLVHELLLGENIYVINVDSYGFVYESWLRYE